MKEMPKKTSFHLQHYVLDIVHKTVTVPLYPLRIRVSALHTLEATAGRWFVLVFVHMQ